MSWKLLAAAALLASLVAPGSSASASITYKGMESFDDTTVDLSITTDGLIGVLGTNDIIDWNVKVDEGAIFGSVDLTPANSQEQIAGSELRATPWGLLFNFTNAMETLEFFLIEEPVIGSNGPFWCAANNGCYPDNTSALSANTLTYNIDAYDAYIDLNGETVIATIPEPSTWAMMLLGFAGLGFVAWGKNLTRLLQASLRTRPPRSLDQGGFASC
jgi:hypothetical protein